MRNYRDWIAITWLSMLGCNAAPTIGRHAAAEGAPSCDANPCGPKCKQTRVDQAVLRSFHIGTLATDGLTAVQKEVKFELASRLEFEVDQCKKKYETRFCGADTWIDWERMPGSEMLCSNYGARPACSAEGYTTCYVAPPTPGPAMPPLPPSRN